MALQALVGRPPVLFDSCAAITALEEVVHLAQKYVDERLGWYFFLVSILILFSYPFSRLTSRYYMNLVPVECKNLPRLSGLLLIDTQAQVRF